MAHKKAAGSSRNGRESASKRLGVKLFGGQIAIAGNIIVRQRGTTFHPGENVGMGKDHTIFSKIDGVVEFKTKRNNRKFISVLPIEAMTEEKPVKIVATKTEPKEEVKAKKAPAKAKKVENKETTVAAKAPKAKKATAKKTSKKGDDLKVINGIGPAFEKRLNVMGIFTYADMAAITVEKAESLEAEFNDAMTSPEEWMDWAKAAKGLMK